MDLTTRLEANGVAEKSTLVFIKPNENRFTEYNQD